MSGKPGHAQECPDSKSIRKPEKKRTADDADSRCKYSLRHVETIDILAIA